MSPFPDSQKKLNDLKKYLEHDVSYQNQFQDKQLLTNQFLKKYHYSLFYYKHFYDDFHEFGNKLESDFIFYFIPGFNGTPGQIKFGIPSILRAFGNNVYIKSCFLPEFSCNLPTWLKYTQANMELKRKAIVKDLTELAKLGKKVRVVVSSSGFYDFLSIFPKLSPIKSQLILYWVSCAPDKVSSSPWEKVFYKINGFKFQNFKWFSYPNIQLLKFLNPECGTKKRWTSGGQRNLFRKNDLESRFYKFGIMWDYISTGLFNEFLKLNLDIFKIENQKIDIETHALAATKDGFWDDSSIDNIRSTIEKYIVDAKIFYKKTSHLWIVTPEHLYEMFESSLKKSG